MIEVRIKMNNDDMIRYLTQVYLDPERRFWWTRRDGRWVLNIEPWSH